MFIIQLRVGVVRVPAQPIACGDLARPHGERIHVTAGEYLLDVAQRLGEVIQEVPGAQREADAQDQSEGERQFAA